MTFEELLERIMAMLRRRKRVTYGALRRQFNLNETYLADLKDAILYAYPQLVEEDSRGLVWTGTALRHPSNQYSSPDAAAVTYLAPPLRSPAITRTDSPT